MKFTLLTFILLLMVTPGWAQSVSAGNGVKQDSITAGEVGPLVQCATTTSAPTNTTAHTNPLNCDTAGALRASITSLTVAAQGFSVGAIPPAAGTLASGAVTSAMTGTTSTSVIGGTASNYVYVTQCTTSSASLTVSTDINLQDGSGGTVLYVLPTPAATVATTGGSGGVFVFPVPLKVPTSGNGLFAVNVTTGSSTKISCSGFKSTVSY